MPTDSRWAGALEWRLIGPHRGGRVVAVVGDPVDPQTFYFGACAGGVWKSTDAGITWNNVSDGYFRTAAIGALAIAPTDRNVVLAGTGETTIRGNVSHGDGVYKSTDGGKTWANVGLKDTRHIARIRVHPQNPDLIYVAALGHAWGSNEERGVFRSKDGGKTWDKILYRDDRTGAIDLSMDPNNPRILYAALWEAQRYPHKLNSGGPGSGLFKSTDGGDTWTELTRNPGLPTGVLGKIGVAVSPAKTDRVWALVEAEDGALFRSDDGGATWTRVCDQGDLRMRAWYYMHIYADPQDAETVWVLNLSCWKSVDGGKTFSEVPTPHGDNQDLWLDPQNPRRMIEGNDGGACVTFNGGETWSSIYNQPTAQFYHVTTDNQTPYRVYGSQQDNTAMCIPSFSSLSAIAATEWLKPGGGESGYIAIKPDDQDIAVAGAIGSGFGNGRLIHYNHRTRQERIITVWPETANRGIPATALKYRFQWTFPIWYSRWDSQALYVAGNRIFKSTDDGARWEVVSPDLTRNDPTRLEASGGPITLDNTGAEVYCTIFAVAESNHEPGVIWTGSDDGLVHLSRDAGKTWTNVTPPELPEWALISIIDASPHDPATAYVAATRYKLDDTRPYLYKTNDYGRSWQKITHGIPDNDFTRVIREDPGRRGLLFAGTETGIYVSYDDGSHWQSLQLNLPVCPIHDLVIKDNDLVVATHGRSFWIMDDITPLRQVDETVTQAPAHLFAPRPAARYKVYQPYASKAANAINYRRAGPLTYGFRQVDLPTGEKRDVPIDAGQNPLVGVYFTYVLKDKPEGEATLTILDSQDRVLRTISSQPKDNGKNGTKKDLRLPIASGVNRFVWNLRTPDATRIGDKATEDLCLGPMAPPGQYRARLQVGQHTSEQPFEVVKDPRVPATQADLDAQYTFLKAIRDKLTETHDAILQLRDLRSQADAWAKRLAGQKASETITTAATALVETCTALEDALVQVKADSPLIPPSRLNFSLAALTQLAENADGAPTRQMREVLADLSARIDTHLAHLRDIVTHDVAGFNALTREAGIATLIA